IAVKLRISKEAGGTSRIVENVEEELAVVVTHTRPAPNDLLEFCHRIDGAYDYDVFAGRNVDACREHLGRRENRRRRSLELHEPAEITPSDVAFIRDHARDVIRKLLREIGVAVVYRAAHLLGVLLIHTED